jgi:hypothetical protein
MLMEKIHPKILCIHEIGVLFKLLLQKTKQTLWPESVSELYQLSNFYLSAKVVPTFADRGMSRSHCGRSPTAVISGI